MNKNHVNYMFQINNEYNTDIIYNKIETNLIELEFDLVFISYNNNNHNDTELKIVFRNHLTNNQEELLMNLLLKYLYVS